MTNSLLIGLAGKRGVGKSTVADYLVKNKGFKSIHTFNTGKEMAIAYYRYIGIDKITAEEMVFGNKKDLNMSILPHDHNSRYFLEELGYFMGTKLGPEWTLGMELRKIKLENKGELPDLICESLVYENDYFKSQGGIVIELVREETGIVGHKSDEYAAQAVRYSSEPNVDSDYMSVYSSDIVSPRANYVVMNNTSKQDLFNKINNIIEIESDKRVQRLKKNASILDKWLRKFKVKKG